MEGTNISLTVFISKQHESWTCSSAITGTTKQFHLSANIKFTTLILKELTPLREMLVSAVMLIMSIYRLPLGQYEYTGYVINLPQDVVSFVCTSPKLPSELSVLVVKKGQ